MNFDVPMVPEDYIHRVGRTGRAEQTGEAFTFVSRDEESDLRAIEKAIGKSLPRVTVPDFDYNARPEAKLEIPLAQRIAEIRARKAQERARGAGRRRGGPTTGSGSGSGHGGRPGGGRPGGGGRGPSGGGGRNR